MAKSNITSPTVLAHKRYARWTDDEINQALSELGVKLEEPFKGSILDKHIVTFPNGVTKSSELCSIFRGVSSGKRVYRHTTESVNEQLAEFNLVLGENFSGSIKDKHLIIFPDGHSNSYILETALRGKVTGKRYTTDTVNQKLSQFGSRLVEEFKGDITQKHLVRFSTGRVKNVMLFSALNGDTTGKLDTIGRYTEETLSDKLSNHNVELLEPFNGNSKSKHKVLFSCGHEHEASLERIFQGTGCPICSKGGFNPYASAQLYYLEIPFQGELVYKLGVTNRTVEKRYSVESRIDYKTLELFEHSDGGLVRQAEQVILKEFGEFRFSGESPFRLTGTRELFGCDIRYYPRFMEIISEYGLEQVLIAN